LNNNDILKVDYNTCYSNNSTDNRYTIETINDDIINLFFITDH